MDTKVFNNYYNALKKIDSKDKFIQDDDEKKVTELMKYAKSRKDPIAKTIMALLVSRYADVVADCTDYNNYDNLKSSISNNSYERISYRRLLLGLNYIYKVTQKYGLTQEQLNIDPLLGDFIKNNSAAIGKYLRKLILEEFANATPEERTALMCIENYEDKTLYATNYEKEINDRKIRPNLKINEFESNVISQLVSPTDLMAMIGSVENGVVIYNLLQVTIKNTLEKTSARNENDQYDEALKEARTLGSYMEECFKSDDYLACIDVQKFYQIQIYRLLNYIDAMSYKETAYYGYEPIAIALKYKKELDKLRELGEIKEDLEIPLLDNVSYSKEQQEEKEAKGDPEICVVKLKDLDDRFKLSIDKAILSLVEEDKNSAYEFLNKEELIFDKDLVKKASELVDNPTDFIYLAYSKKGYISSKDMAEICMENGFTISEILTKLIVDQKKISARDEKKEFLKDKSIADFINVTVEKNNKGYIPSLVKKLYENGTISVNDINNLKEYFKENQLEERGNLELLEADTKELVYLYKRLNKDKIISIFKQKENFTDEDIEQLISENPELKGDLSKEEKLELQEKYKFQKELFFSNKLFNNDEEREILLDELGELGISSNILIDLYKEGIIDLEAGIEIDPEGFKEFYNGYNAKKFSKSKMTDYKKESTFLNAYAHGKISKKEIVEGYALGEIPQEFYDLVQPEIYSELNNEEVSAKKVNDILEKGFLRELYSQAIKKDASAQTFEKFKKYYTECKSLSPNDEFFKDYIEKQLIDIQEGRISKKSLLKLGKAGVLSKEALGELADRGNTDVIADLMINENVIGIDMSKYLFEDKFSKENQLHNRRDLLENIFKKYHFSNTDKMSILISTYSISDDMDENQQKLNNENFAYFIERGYIKSLEEFGEYEANPVPTHRGENGEGGSTPNQQQSFPLLERIGVIRKIDSNMEVEAKNNGFIFKSPKYKKTIIESLGKKLADDNVQNDQTNHRTYIINQQEYEKQKSRILGSSFAGVEIAFIEIIKLFRENKGTIDYKYFNHSKNWENNLTKYFKSIQKSVSKEL